MHDQDERNPFGIEPEDEGTIMDALYGPTEGLKGDPNRIVANSIALGDIWADVKQPRRAIPASIRLHWGGDPTEVPDLLAAWHMIAQERAAAAIDVVALLDGRGEGLAIEEWPAIARDYVELVRLAASIRADGLLNPINVAQIGKRYVIVAGERRWLAFNLLYIFDASGDWGRIPAQKVSDRDYIWKQATENTSRRSLNAISMARQLALLIMAARDGIDGQRYNEYDELVLPGGCDRRYYAQIANGNVHRIPRGMGERIQAAMALSEKRIADYRRLLRMTDDDVVNDALWVRGDVEDWAEMALRSLYTLPIGKVREVIERETWSLEDLKGLLEAPPTAPAVTMPAGMPPARFTPQERPMTPLRAGLQAGAAGKSEGDTLTKVKVPTRWKVGDRVVTPGGASGTVDNLLPSGKVLVLTTRGSWAYDPGQLTRMPEAAELTDAGDLQTGDAVMILATEEIGMALGFSDNGRVLVDVNDNRVWYGAHELVAMHQSAESFAEDEIEAGEADFSEWDEGEAPSLPTPLSPTGTLRSHEERGGTEQMKPDKADSVGPTPAANSIDNWLVWKPNSDERAQLQLIVSLARGMGQADVHQLVAEVRDMTPAQIQRLAAKGLLEDQLKAYHDAISQLLYDWLDRDLSRILDTYLRYIE